MFELKRFLDEKANQYNQPSFIGNDPIAIPHLFAERQDREIAGLFAALLAWGQRKTILAKSRELMGRMGNEPFRFVREHGKEDLRGLLGFKHRTFNDTDLLFFIRFLQRHYSRFDSLEDAFLSGQDHFQSIEDSLIRFQHTFFNDPYAPVRTRKHVASPARNATCKRLNMYLRWMVRSDERGVDFGIWKRIPQRELICPLDLHVDRTARALGLITRRQTDWKTAWQLTESLRRFDREDPVKYDFALFGLSVAGDSLTEGYSPPCSIR
ncbi:MAG: TIGR02757 family protein [Proteiniphilum sp.]|jgi:uncharacterized protein (TIGR02757 family)|nr:TIGR02757 family protein [Proteiniphilum sp.]NCD13753.1 TIGR02757 family protein [Bacteroidia bacterium]HHT33552.1 TIGR02757 family protein [Bacteroidales bacterium]MDD2725859.1 TIGR02757 family protein [Proteiniphilum sp.]MDD3331916.1 TIGR02757 family protein [Proteiniphilum sp.]